MNGGESQDGVYFEQTSNLDLSAYPNWIPIGIDEPNPFSGNYNGLGHSVTNLNQNRSADLAGLFGAMIKSSGYGELSNLTVSGTVINSALDATLLVGAILNYNIYNCHTSGSVNGSRYAGGFAGVIFGCNVNGCSTNINLVNTDIECGGFTAHAENSIISNCFSTGLVRSGDLAGGFMCYSINNLVENCYSRANLVRTTGTSVQFAGFIITNGTDSSTNNCYSTGWLKEGSEAGENLPMSGFILGNIGTISNCFWDEQASYCTYSAGEGEGVEGKTTAQMTNMTTFSSAGWDISASNTGTVWNIGNSHNNGYPYFSWQYSGGTLPVTLSSFTGLYSTSNNVTLSWTTQSESSMLGYNIYRNTSDNFENSVRVNFSIIPSQNQSVTHNYSYSETDFAPDTNYYYWLEAVQYDGMIQSFGPVSIKTGGSATSPEEQIFFTKLHNAYPNPFNPSTSLAFELAKPSQVNIEIFNAKGQKICTLTERNYSAGKHSVVWNGKDFQQKPCGSGVYFSKMTAGTYKQINKMMLIK